MNSLCLATAFETHRRSSSLLSLFSHPRFSKLNPLCWPVMQTARKNAVFMSVLSMHIDGEARTKGDMESREIKGFSEKAEEVKTKYIYLFIEQQGSVQCVRTVITHYQQRRRAKITGRCCEARRPGVLMKLHNTKQCNGQRKYCGLLK